MTSQIDPSIWLGLQSLWQSFDRYWRRRFWGLIALSLLASVGEILSIGSLLPFLVVLTDPSKVLELPLIGGWLRALAPDGALSSPHAIVLFGLIFGGMVLSASLIRWWLSAACARFAYEVGGVLGQRIFRVALMQPYAFHLQRTSSEIIDVVATRVQMVVSSILMAGLQLLTALIMVIAIAAVLFLFDPVLAPMALAGFVVVYVLVYYISRRRLKNNSQRMSEVGAKRYQLLQEGLGGIRDIHLDASQDFFVQAFARADNAFRRAQSQNAIISASPRYLVEGLGTLLLAALAVAYVVGSAAGGVVSGGSSATGGANLVPMLGVLVLSAQRLLPLLQQIYAGWTSIRGVTDTLHLVTHWLRLPVTDQTYEATQIQQQSATDTTRQFRRTIELRQVAFSYQPEAAVLNGLDLVIQKGQCIGIVGVTGEGKSTLLDVLMGLLKPDVGQLLIDGKSVWCADNDLAISAWQAQIAHVPQHIFLADTSILSNVAFGVATVDIDVGRVRWALEVASLLTFVDSLPDGLQTEVGERGVRLSGGQRQRIGVARALYKNAGLLVLDEATSALDAQTESTIVHALARLSPELTMVMVSHRASALDRCDVVYRLEQGKLVPIHT